MSKVGIVYAKEVPMIKVKQVKEINGKGTPLHTVIQYWTKDGILVAEGKVNQCDERLVTMRDYKKGRHLHILQEHIHVYLC